MLTALLFAGNVLPCAFPSYAETEVIETVAAAEAGESENQAAQENSAEAGTPEVTSEEKTDNAEVSAEQPVTAAETSSEAVIESEVESEGQAETEGAAGEAQPEGQEAAESTETAETVAEPEETTEAAESSETAAEADTQETVAEEVTEESANTEASEPASELASPSNAEYVQETAEASAEDENKKVYTETVDGITVTVTADAGVFPEGAELKVEKIEKDEYDSLDEELEEAVSAKRKRNTKAGGSFVFDITMLVDGEEVQPDNSKGKVYVTFAMEKVLENKVSADVYHIREDEKNDETVITAEKLELLPEKEAEKFYRQSEEENGSEIEAVPEDGAILNDLSAAETEEETAQEEAEKELVLTASIDGFSYYIVEFSYPEYTFDIVSREGAEPAPANSEYIWYVMKKFGLNDEAVRTILDAELINDAEGALEIVKDSSEDSSTWYLKVNNPFSGAGTLRVTTSASQEYEIEITCSVNQKYIMKYISGTQDRVSSMPENNEGEGGISYRVSDLTPERDGYEFIDWTLYLEECYTVELKKFYKVTYVVNPDKTYGTPEGSTVPTDPTRYAPNAYVKVADQLTTTVDYAYNEKGEKVKGTWEFVTWDKSDFEITDDTTITGGWRFTPAPAIKYNYTVEYWLVDGTKLVAKVADDKSDTVDALGTKVVEEAIPMGSKLLKPKYRSPAKYRIKPHWEKVTATINKNNQVIYIFYELIPHGQ